MDFLYPVITKPFEMLGLKYTEDQQKLLDSIINIDYFNEKLSNINEKLQNIYSDVKKKSNYQTDILTPLFNHYDSKSTRNFLDNLYFGILGKMNISTSATIDIFDFVVNYKINILKELKNLVKDKETKGDIQTFIEKLESSKSSKSSEEVLSNIIIEQIMKIH